MFLDHRVDVEVDRHLVAREEADVGPVFVVLREPDDLLDRGRLGPVHRFARAERRPRDLEKSAVIPISDHADLGGDSLFDIDGIAIAQELGSVQREVRLPLNLVHSAEDQAAGLMPDLNELVPLDRLGDGAMKGRRPDVPVDHTDEAVAVMARRPMVGGGFHACIPRAA